MIVAADFLEHWKTRQLIELTHGDESAPLALIRLWAYCQSAKRWEFPGMGAQQLASICRWGKRKPMAETALTKCGFLEVLPGGGYKAHDWDEYNAQLIQKWHAGKNGGRKPTRKNPNETGQIEKPIGYRSPTGSEPIGLDPIGLDTTRPAPARTEAVPLPEPVSLAIGDGGVGRTSQRAKVGALIADVAAQFAVIDFPVPSLAEVRSYLDGVFPGASQHATTWIAAMEKQHWRDRDGQPIRNWRALVKAYANAIETRQRGIGKRAAPKPPPKPQAPPTPPVPAQAAVPEFKANSRYAGLDIDRELEVLDHQHRNNNEPNATRENLKTRLDAIISYLQQLRECPDEQARDELRRLIARNHGDEFAARVEAYTDVVPIGSNNEQADARTS